MNDLTFLSFGLMLSLSMIEGSELLGYGTKFGTELDSHRKNVIGGSFSFIYTAMNGAEEFCQKTQSLLTYTTYFYNVVDILILIH